MIHTEIGNKMVAAKVKSSYANAVGCSCEF